MGPDRVKGASRARRIFGGALAFVAGAMVVSCVIAEPATDLPSVPVMRPIILRGSVVPSVSAVLGRWPKSFIVPVELVDPRVTFLYSAFVDFNDAPGAPSGLDGPAQESQYEVATTQGRVRTIEVPIVEPPSGGCHVVEIVVAYRFEDPTRPHTPAEPGGDSVQWFYSPGGDLAGCPVLDAGIEPLDAGVD